MAIRNFNDKFARRIVEHEHRINCKITAKEVRLIDQNGEQCGVVLKYDALRKAELLNLDLVEISATSNPPVCKIMDYSKFVYEKRKKEKVNKQQSRVSKLKEITIRSGIDKHDLETKLKHARAFLNEGNKVKISLRLRGRELQYANERLDVLKSFVENLSDCSKLDGNLKTEKTTSMIILQPLKDTTKDIAKDCKDDKESKP
jgi:translation initiation factor IF-3